MSEHDLGTNGLSAGRVEKVAGTSHYGGRDRATAGDRARRRHAKFLTGEVHLPTGLEDHGPPAHDRHRTETNATVLNGTFTAWGRAC